MKLATAALLILLTGAVTTATADSLLLPVPGANENSRERINLSITIPNKSTPRPEEPARERIKSSALAGVDWHPFKGVPQKKFVFDTLRTFRRKGFVRLIFDQTAIDDEFDSYENIGRVVARTYAFLLDVYRKDALKRFGVIPTDIERFQRVIDLFGPGLAQANFNPVEVNRNLDAMLDYLKKTSGRGQIRITGLREQKDGTTLLEMEILRGPQYNK